MELENGFDLHGDVPGEGAHADCTAGADAMFAAEHLGKELAAAIDHIRMFSKIGRCVHHAEHLDHSCDAIEMARALAGLAANMLSAD